MEPVSNITKPTQNTQEDFQKQQIQQDMESHSLLEAVTETISNVVEKTKEMIGLGPNESSETDGSSQASSSSSSSGLQQKASEIKETIQQKATDAKDAVQKKVSEWIPNKEQANESQEKKQTNAQEEPFMSKKMRNWNESLHKIEEQHEKPIAHPNQNVEAHHAKDEAFKKKHKTLEVLEHELEEKHKEEEQPREEKTSSPQPTTSTTTLQEIQHKLVDVKDTVEEKLIQAKDLVGEKLIQAKEAIVGPSESNKPEGDATTKQAPSSSSVATEMKEKRDEQEEQNAGLISTVSSALHTAVETGKDLLEKAGTSIAHLATGTATTDQGEIEKKVEPLDEEAASIKDQQQKQQPSVGDKARAALGRAGDKVNEWKDEATSKIDQWTEGSLGEISVVDPTKKNKEDATQPGQPKDLQKEQVPNQSLASEQKITSA